MPSVLPTIEKTWQKSLNNYAGTQGSLNADARQMWRALKNQLLGSPGSWTNPWTTYYSCNGTTAGSAGDVTDRWTADSNLNWSYLSSGATRSWYVFKNTAIGSNFQMLWALEYNVNSAVGNYERFIYVSVSPSAGYTGGTTTVRPSATDEVTLLNPTDSNNHCWNANHTSSVAYRWNMWHTSDGIATHFIILYNNIVLARFQIGTVKNPTSGWASPTWWGSFLIPNTNLGTSITATNEANRSGQVFSGNFARSRIAGINVTNGNYTGEGSTGAQFNQLETFPNDIDLTYKFSPIGIFSPSIAGTRGHHGIIYDIWQAGPAWSQTGNTFPSDGSRQFTQFGCELYPWDGSLPLTA